MRMQLLWERHPSAKVARVTQKRAANAQTSQSGLASTSRSVESGKNEKLFVLNAVERKLSCIWKNEGSIWQPTVHATASRNRPRLREGRFSRNAPCHNAVNLIQFRSGFGAGGWGPSRSSEPRTPSPQRGSSWHRYMGWRRIRSGVSTTSGYSA